jgi:putative peptidoglycan lipid II flippase
LVKVSSLAKDLIVARQFGISDALDAFLIAFAVPSFLGAVFSEALAVALVPTYIQLREREGREAAQRLFSSIMVWGGILLVAVSVLLAVSAPYILSVLTSSFSPEKLALTRSLLYLLLPALAIGGMSRVWGSILNSGEHFALVAGVAITTPIVTVVSIILMDGLWGIYSYAVGIIGGVLLEAAVLVWALRRQGFSLAIRWPRLDPSTKQVMSQFVPVLSAALLFSGSGFVDQAMAALLGSGSVSTLNYGSKVVYGINGIAGAALYAAVLPYLSQMVATNDWSGVRHTLRTYAALILGVTIPVTIGLVYFSEPLVRLMFQRGEFTAEDTHVVAQVQALFFLQMPFYIMDIFLTRLISSLNANRWLIWRSVIGLLLNIILNYVFMQWLGVAGIALSTSIVFMVLFFYLWFTVARLLKEAPNSRNSTGDPV